MTVYLKAKIPRGSRFERKYFKERESRNPRQDLDPREANGAGGGRGANSNAGGKIGKDTLSLRVKCRGVSIWAGASSEEAGGWKEWQEEGSAAGEEERRRR